MTTIPQSEHPAWEAFKANFVQSNYITDVWNWLLTLLSKSAELVLFGSILYSSYQLVPGVPSVPPAIDAMLFLVQQAALDIGGMGLVKLAKRAGLSRRSFPMQVGITLVVLMIANVVLATVKHLFPSVPAAVFMGAEALLLIARAVMAVLFGHAIHALREEYGDSSITVQEARTLQEQIGELSSELSAERASFHQQLAQLSQNFQQQLSVALSHLESCFQQDIRESSSRTDESVQAQLSSLRENVQQVHELVTLVSALQVRLHRLEDGQTRPTKPERPVLRVLAPVASPEASSEGKVDARAFVFASLHENPGLKLSELVQLAREHGYELSQPTASRYRKQFFASCESFHESSDASCESSAMKVRQRSESAHECESAFTDERQIASE